MRPVVLERILPNQLKGGPPVATMAKALPPAMPPIMGTRGAKRLNRFGGRAW